ncbi:MAG: hypothetical protein LBK95_17490, partial [Bifidobacteriaceae bacterium]|nr:hypothetical protein [Bifidobacteriaceae bacterium]
MKAHNRWLAVGLAAALGGAALVPALDPTRALADPAPISVTIRIEASASRTIGNAATAPPSVTVVDPSSVAWPLVTTLDEDSGVY